MRRPIGDRTSSLPVISDKIAQNPKVLLEPHIVFGQAWICEHQLTNSPETETEFTPGNQELGQNRPETLGLFDLCSGLICVLGWVLGSLQKDSVGPGTTLKS